MRITKIILVVVLTIALSLTTVAYGQYTLSEQQKGGRTPAHHISKQGRQFVINEFGECKDLPELINAIGKYEMEHFSYDYDYIMPIIQDFDFDTLVKEEKGVCWEFAAFAKTVIGEICAIKGWEMSNYIVDVRLKKDFSKTHSYNYVIDNNTIHVFDMTCAVVENRIWYETFTGNSVADIYDYADRLQESAYRVG